MRQIIVITLVIAFCCGWLRGSDYRDTSSGVIFPEVVGTLQRGKETKYRAEPREEGVAIPYRGKDAEVTVYVRRLPAGATVSAGEAVKEAIAGVRKLEALGHYSDVKLYQLDQQKTRAGWSAAAFTAKSQDYPIVSFIYCRTTPDHLFKVRATAGDVKNGKLTTDLDLLLKVIDRDESKP